MHWLNKLEGFQRAAPGLEWQIAKRLGPILLWGTVLPLLVGGLFWGLASATPTAAEERALLMTGYRVAGWILLHWTLVFTVGIGCGIVMLMKGPAYVADPYPPPERDRPEPER